MRIIIFANGNLPDLNKARALLRTDDFIIAADGGTRHALALGLTPNLVIGDLDSITHEEKQMMDERGVTIVPYSHDKNETDLELSIKHALEMNPDEIRIIAALGERLDQTLSNLALLSDLRLSTFDARMDDGVEEVLFCRSQVEVRGRSGDIVSLIPWQGAVEGVQTENLRWHLRDETLHPEKSRGISNEMLSETAGIRIRAGMLLVIHRHNS